MYDRHIRTSFFAWEPLLSESDSSEWYLKSGGDQTNGVSSEMSSNIPIAQAVYASKDDVIPPTPPDVLSGSQGSGNRRKLSLTQHLHSSRSDHSEQKIAEARALLTEKNWPHGLQSLLFEEVRKLPLRVFIIDDSGSMSSTDGKKNVMYKGKNRLVKCSRYEELAESMTFHAKLSHKLAVESHFYFLNSTSTPVIIGAYGSGSQTQEESANQIGILEAILGNSPGGGTPLCRTIDQVIKRDIRPAVEELRAAGQRISLVICSDGESSDGQVSSHLRVLHGLPVWVVVRLCTDEDKVSHSTLLQLVGCGCYVYRPTS